MYYLPHAPDHVYCLIQQKGFTRKCSVVIRMLINRNINVFIPSPFRWLFNQTACTVYAFCGVLFGLCSLTNLTVLSCVCWLKVCWPNYGNTISFILLLFIVTQYSTNYHTPSVSFLLLGQTNYFSSQVPCHLLIPLIQFTISLLAFFI